MKGVFQQRFVLVKLVDGLSYNQIVEKVVSTDDESESCLLRNFLDVSASQLTTQGIAELLLNLDDGEIAVLFRNNHFQTLSKHKVCVAPLRFFWICFFPLFLLCCLLIYSSANFLLLIICSFLKLFFNWLCLEPILSGCTLRFSY